MWDVPEGWNFNQPTSKAISNGVDWVVINWETFFDAINKGILALMVPMEDFFLWLPWWSVILITAAIAWKVVGLKTAIGSAIGITVMAVLGLLDYAMQTLAIVVASTILAIGLGLPLGIMGARSDRADRLMRPVLDTMQTIPSFVYLVPALMLFGLGKVPSVMATLIYAIPPMIRLTNLGIRQVDEEVIEAARAFGSTASQILLKVQIPMAIPTIMAGVNQTIMMAMAMVVVAAYIGAAGLGVEVLNGIARIDVGRGVLGGTGIVIMAIIIDRITQGLAKPNRSQSK